MINCYKCGVEKEKDELRLAGSERICHDCFAQLQVEFHAIFGVWINDSSCGPVIEIDDIQKIVSMVSKDEDLCLSFITHEVLDNAG